jgi:hypothetical protein
MKAAPQPRRLFLCATSLKNERLIGVGAGCNHLRLAHIINMRQRGNCFFLKPKLLLHQVRKFIDCHYFGVLISFLINCYVLISESHLMNLFLEA